MSSLAHVLPTRELVLDRYRAVRPLGSGGNGSVWLARDEQTGLDVALKIVPREGKAAARAEREALAARRLRHRRCVRAYDVGHDHGHVYIAYEYVPGRTLREALRAGDVGDLEAVEIGAQVLEALAHAHRTGIVHRDVKPSNILLEHSDEIAAKLLDFGLAQFDGADTLTAVGDVPGTLAYIAPERLGGDEATPASDVWAVGVLLWEALAGQHPFWGMPLQEVALAIERGAEPLATHRSDLPRRLLTAVDRALSPDPAARPHATTLGAELRAAFRQPEPRRVARVAKSQTAIRPLPLVRKPLTRIVPVAAAGAAAAVGVTLLPFWPPALALAIVVAAGAGAALHPRLGLAIALAAPIFPLGNEARSAALLYVGFAVAWLALTWREARFGVLFFAGPLLAPLGALALVPLMLQPLRSPFLQAAQGALAVLAATFAASVAGDTGLAPADTVTEAALALWSALAAQPAMLATALAAALVTTLLPLARRRHRYGIATVGVVVSAGAVVIGPGGTGTVLGVLLTCTCWGIAALLAAGSRR
ncbi:MAG: serine/threonine protein kinase [Actinobacteria bacterium]|nr:serine/threonine protein kinase [Actinomycetota bacterium]